ncbi:MAG: hypothetical protein ACRBFS_17560 [Aureispira sp.]
MAIQKGKIHQLFFSLGKQNKALAFELAKAINYYEDFVEELYQQLMRMPHFESEHILYKEVYKKQEVDQKSPIPTGIKLKKAYVNSFFEYNL